MKNCIAAWVASCSRDCATPRCVSNCTAQAHDMCAKDITAPQLVFTGPVVATPTNECDVQERPSCSPPLDIDTPGGVTAGSTCSTVSGAVTNSQFWGGNVTIYVICAAGAPTGSGNQGVITTVIGRGQSSCTNGKFVFVTTNACSGQTGCYALVAITPPTSCQACGTCGTAAVSHDPGWAPCTGGPCPNP